MGSVHGLRRKDGNDPPKHLAEQQLRSQRTHGLQLPVPISHTVHNRSRSPERSRPEGLSRRLHQPHQRSEAHESRCRQGERNARPHPKQRNGRRSRQSTERLQPLPSQRTPPQTDPQYPTQSLLRPTSCSNRFRPGAHQNNARETMVRHPLPENPPPTRPREARRRPAQAPVRQHHPTPATRLLANRREANQNEATDQQRRRRLLRSPRTLQRTTLQGSW